MKKPETPHNESDRMALIHQLNILDTESEEIYDGITYIASLICNTPISTITIVDTDRQWFKSIIGGNGKENPREVSFCAHAILGNEILEIPDSQNDERFKDNPLVTGDPHVRFYAGAPLELQDGLRVGTLCVIDHKPNKLNEQQLKMLHYLSLQVTKLLELRLKVKEVEVLRENDASIVKMLTHELRNPLITISGFMSIPMQSKEKYHDENYDVLIEKCSRSTDRMLNIINEFLNYSHWKDGFWTLNKQKNDLNACLKESVDLTKGYADKCKVHLELYLNDSIPPLDFDYAAILSVLENLISNAAKYSKEEGKIILSADLEKESVTVKVQDFGVGIAEKDREKLFKPFALQNQKNKMGIKGSGLGLSIVKKIIEKHGGKLQFDSIEGQGTTFYFTLPL